MGLFQGRYEPVRNEDLDIGLTSVKICDARSDNNENIRKVIVIRNISPNATDTISIFLGNGLAENNKGIVLKQYESFTDSYDASYLPHQDQISGICATATGKVSIMER
jgi:hypothetical protein